MTYLEFLARQAGPLLPGLQLEASGGLSYSNPEGTKIKIREPREFTGMPAAFDRYMRAKSKAFDAMAMRLTLNNSVEQAVIPLAPYYFRDPNISYKDRHGNIVSVAPASFAFMLAHAESPAYNDYITPNRFESRSYLATDDFLWRGLTVTYKGKGHKVPPDLQDIARRKIGTALFKTALEENRAFVPWGPFRRSGLRPYLRPQSSEVLPTAHYDENAVRYYMVAKSSPFPSQAFVAFYNVLEYYFLSTAEDKLHHRLRALLNGTNFVSDSKGLDGVITVVRSEDAQREELSMLRNVIDRFLSEDELIDFIAKHETERGERVYSKKRVIFGEQLEISLTSGHCRSNSAKAIRHIRNAIVHSSDRYKREECHVPLSDSELIVDQFIPLIQFLAERVIFGTAT